MKQLVRMNVNGDEREVYCDTRRTLLDVLRGDFALLGTHRGCDSGDCGACTVLLDDVPVTACLVLAADCEGSQILTVEGLAPVDHLQPLQRMLVERGGIQCGFCTPGMVISGVALLQENPRPDETQVRQALAGNLCRCTGYKKVVEAVLAAAADGAAPNHERRPA